MNNINEMTYDIEHMGETDEGDLDFEDFDDEPLTTMTETEKIEVLIREYRPYLEMTDMDISRSVKGRYFFFRYNKEFDYYDIYSEFETADELVTIMVTEMCSDMNFLIGKRYIRPERLHKDLGNFIGPRYCFEETIQELAQHMGILAEYSALT